MQINVTKTYMPGFNKYVERIKHLWDSAWITNNGKYVQELEERLKEYLDVPYIVLVANGTLGLQVAYKLLDLKGEVITTPFSFVATVSSMVWEGLKPVFVDIDPESLTIDVNKIEGKITDKTSAIVPVHVYGNACNIEGIERIAKKYNLKIIYDSAHAFDVKYNGKSILNYGDISVISFHATKLFHTIEGGAIILNDEELYRKVKQMINFGYEKGEIKSLGINAKMNEFEAIMGLGVLEEIDKIVEGRREVWEYYYEKLKNIVRIPKFNIKSTCNYSYFPVIFRDEDELLRVKEILNKNNIYPRRYFYPSLSSLDYVESQYTPVADEISRRVLCLPIYHDLTLENQKRIIEYVKEGINKK